MLRRALAVTSVLFVCALMIGPAGAAPAPPGLILPSSDGVPISYFVHGKGDVTLVFVHGWSGQRSSMAGSRR
jgi:hypothetical protein